MDSTLLQPHPYDDVCRNRIVYYMSWTEKKQQVYLFVICYLLEGINMAIRTFLNGVQENENGGYTHFAERLQIVNYYYEYTLVQVIKGNQTINSHSILWICFNLLLWRWEWSIFQALGGGCCRWEWWGGGGRFKRERERSRRRVPCTGVVALDSNHKRE